jgi:hypothetical protein
MPRISGTVVPTGGAITLSIDTAPSGTVTLERAVSGSSGLGAFTILYSADVTDPLRLYLDTGDGLPEPLDPTQLYVYQLTDVDGTVQTPAIQPVAALTLLPSPLTEILIRLLQAGINSMVPNPAGVRRAKVLSSMPLGGLPPMPFVTVNLDLEQQDQIPIGQDVANYNAKNEWVMTGFAKRIWRVSVLADSVVERDFYKNAVIGIFNAVLPSTFAQIGLDVTHRYQASTGQVSNEPAQNLPGFWFAEIMIELTGTMNLIITGSYGVISTITMAATVCGAPSGVPAAEIQVEVPIAG